jgi:hypothetical protein
MGVFRSATSLHILRVLLRQSGTMCRQPAAVLHPGIEMTGRKRLSSRRRIGFGRGLPMIMQAHAE